MASHGTLSARTRAYCEAEGIDLGQPTLVAVSGGVDSITLLHMLVELECPVAVAHVNYGLRPGDCDLDEQLVRNTAQRLGVACHVYNATDDMQQPRAGESIQMLARRLRYTWFRKLCETHGYTAIATAHHLTDNIETSLHHQLRGTGLRGVRGMLPVADDIVRPLLSATKAELLDYANVRDLTWREDHSNLTTKYRRNAIRHGILPALADYTPDYEQRMAHTLRLLRDTEQLLLYHLDEWRERLLTTREDGTQVFFIAAVRDSPAPSLLLHELLGDYGFTATQLDDAFGGSGPGRLFESRTHWLHTERNDWVITSRSFYAPPMSTTEVIDSLPSQGGETIVYSNQIATLHLTRQPRPAQLAAPPHLLYLDPDTLALPLTWRPWEPGDRFAPFGMGGKHKKVKALLTDLKLTTTARQNATVLVDAHGRICWVVGYRGSEAHRVGKYAPSEVIRLEHTALVPGEVVSPGEHS